VVASLSPEAGAALSFLSGGFTDTTGKFIGVGATIQDLGYAYSNLKATQELERFAKKNGLTLAN